MSTIVCTALALLTAPASQFWDSVCNESHVHELQVNFGPQKRDPSGVHLKKDVCVGRRKGVRRQCLQLGGDSGCRVADYSHVNVRYFHAYHDKDRMFV